MKLFDKPKWLKPEINDGMYWVHIAIIVFVVYWLMQWNNPGQQYWLYGLYLAIADVVAHTVLGLD